VQLPFGVYFQKRLCISGEGWRKIYVYIFAFLCYTIGSMRRVGRPGQHQSHIHAGVFPEKGDSGLYFRVAVAYLFCLFLKGVYFWQKN
jgi:hypothetical protein